METIRFEQVGKTFGTHEIFRDLTFSILPQKVTALCAPSGFGKTTLLRMLCGLEEPTAGTITGRCPEETACVFQENRLFPCAAWQNIACVCKGTATERKALALTWLSRVGLAQEATKKPSALSGGQQRRVALAQALASERPLLLLDEPFSGIDAARRSELLTLLKTVCLGKTTVLVSHAVEEVTALADVCYDLSSSGAALRAISR